jgi:hypothetical protein
MFFSFFDAKTTLVLIQQAGFTIVHHDIESQLEQGREVPYFWVLGSKPA